jgi:2,3-dimethylmalate lyase
VAPGVSDGVAAALAAEAGFEAIYVSGAGAAAARGWPDMSVMTLGELVDATRVVTTRSGLPAIVDLDTGYGGPLSLRRALLELEQAGAGAVHLEDQEFPRRCGYLTMEPCISIVEMEHRLASARAVDSDLVLIARTDSLLTDGVEDAAVRAAAYHEAGADLIFVNGIRTLDELAQIHETVGAPMLYNVSGSDRSPRLSPSKAADYGVRLIIYPIQADRAAALATERFLAALAADDVDSLPELLGFERFMDLAGWSEAQSFEDSLPDLPA